MVNGHTSLSLELREALAPLVGTRHIVLFPTGWAAGFGAITGLMRRDDHILIDELAHACLRRGALAATPHVSPFPHLDNDAAETRLRAIRQREPRAAIMVITEGVFSMDSDSPRLTRLRELCRDYNAVLLVDQAHDLGVTGPGGTGRVGAEGLVGEVDLVVGSFSKVFACNGGFVATPSAEVASYLRMFAESHAYSCALSPLQAAGALAAARIVQSGEGQRLRDRVLGAATRLRDALRAEGLVVLGEPSPVVPVEVGAAAVARRSWALAEAGGLITSLVEFPIVPRGHSRFRMQVMADHSDADIDQAAHILGGCIATARHAAAVLA